jgi:hypothetical protein
MGLACIYHPNGEILTVTDAEREALVSAGEWYRHPDDAKKAKEDQELGKMAKPKKVAKPKKENALLDLKLSSDELEENKVDDEILTEHVGDKSNVENESSF